MKVITMTLLLSALVLFSSCVEEEQAGDCIKTESCESSPAGGTEDAPDLGSGVPDAPAPPAREEDSDIFDQVASYISRWVDDSENLDELSEVRDGEQSTIVDQCHESFENQDRFADTVAFFIREQETGRKVTIQSIASYYGTSSDLSTHEEVGLFTHPLCRVTSGTLSSTIKKSPDSTTINRANRFAELHNEYREGYLKGDIDSRLKLERHWGAFFGCLAYKESLSTADQSSSQSVAASVVPSGYRKPAGVKFYNDKYQPPSSRLNIGLYQFTPNYSGNINPCLKQWNQDYPSCQTEARSQGDLIKLLGSSQQRFNAFCGINKLLQTFSIQVNTKKSKHTHPDNRTSSGLKGSDVRCVTPHFYAGWAYNHFGPLQNSTGSNMSKLFSCINDSLPDGL